MNIKCIRKSSGIICLYLLPRYKHHFSAAQIYLRVRPSVFPRRFRSRSYTGPSSNHFSMMRTLISVRQIEGDATNECPSVLSDRDRVAWLEDNVGHGFDGFLELGLVGL
jgi:hypothetical protein